VDIEDRVHEEASIEALRELHPSNADVAPLPTEGWLANWRRRRVARAVGKTVATKTQAPLASEHDEMFDDDDLDAFIAIRAGVWASANDIPCTIWRRFNGDAVDRLLKLIPEEESASV